MPNTTHYGSLKTGTAGAAEQAAKIGAVIGPDGWWYLNGRRLSPQEADALTQQAGVAVQTTDDAHGAGHGTLRDLYDREPQWLKTVQTLGADTGNPAIDQKRLIAAGAAAGPIIAAGGAATAGASQIVGVAGDGSFIYGPAASGAGAAGGLGGIAGGLGKALGGLSASDWLKAIGGGVEGAMNYKNQQGLLDQRKREFERTQGMAEGQQAVKAQQLLNAAPAADQASYLLRARMGAAPQTFAPRDYTRTGPANMGVATGGPATQIAAGQQAAASYRPGMGGYNTDILDLFRKKMAAGLGA